MALSDSSLESVQFNYSQKMVSSLTKEVRASSGTAYFKKPGMLRIEQVKPERQLIVSAGKFVFIYTPRFHQVIKKLWKRYFSDHLFFPGLLGFSDTLKKLKKEYQWKIVGTDMVGGEKTLTVRLKSLSQDRQGRTGHLDLWVGESDFIPRKTELVEGTLKVTTVLGSLQLNPKLEPQLFKFRKPANTELIRLH